MMSRSFVETEAVTLSVSNMNGVLGHLWNENNQLEGERLL